MRYCTKYVEFNALQFDGTEESAEFIRTMFPGSKFYIIDEEDRDDDPDLIAAVYDKLHSRFIPLHKSDYIIEGLEGEYYPCIESVFNRKYYAL